MLTWTRQRGFNLIEAMVTLSVLALLIATALPDMSSWMHSTAVRTIAETTENGLQKARAEAIKRNKVVTFWLVQSTGTMAAPDDTCSLNSSSAAWVVSLNDPSSHCGDGASATTAPFIVETYGPGSNAAALTIAATDKSNNAATSVSFNGYGQALAGGLSKVDIQYSSDTGARRLIVQVSASGSVRLCDHDVTAPDPRACTP